MEKIINYSNLRQFTYSNDKLIKHNPKGFVIDFMGLNFSQIIDDDSEYAKFFAERDIIYIIPYYNPWSWMNKSTVALVDEIIDVLVNKYKLGDNAIIASTGGSMGGHAALTYSVYAKTTPKICVTNCAVCDAVSHFFERYDTPRTFYSSVSNENCSLEDALKAVSPLYLREKMPDIEYHIFHSIGDGAVNIKHHSDAFCEMLEEIGRNYTYDRIDAFIHCELTSLGKEKYDNYILSAFEG